MWLDIVYWEGMGLERLIGGSVTQAEWSDGRCIYIMLMVAGDVCLGDGMVELRVLCGLFGRFCVLM